MTLHHTVNLDWCWYFYPPCPWTASRSLCCETLNRWRWRRCEQTSSSPTASALGGSPPGQAGTWSWWGAAPSGRCSQRTEARPWIAARRRHSAASCRHFAGSADIDSTKVSTQIQINRVQGHTQTTSDEAHLHRHSGKRLYSAKDGKNYIKSECKKTTENV